MMVVSIHVTTTEYKTFCLEITSTVYNTEKWLISLKLRILGFRFIPRFRHENFLPISFWSLSLGLLLMTLNFPVPVFVEIFSSSENVRRCLWSCKFDDASLSRLECLEK